MEQSRKEQLIPLRDARVSIFNAHREEFRAKIHAINSRPHSEEKEGFIKQAESWREKRIASFKEFRRIWQGIYGFEYLPDCGCEERIPREEFDYIKQGLA